MRVDRGIPLPQNIESSGLTCVQVYIPTDDEGMYIQALAGAFSQMGKWNYWQKDGTDRGAQVAEIWREAIDLTYEEAWLDGVFMSCTDMQILVDAISDLTARLEATGNRVADAIHALELTTAPLDCIDCADRVDVPPTPSPDPDPQNPPVGNDPSEWAAYLCRGANYLWYDHVMRGGAEMMLLATTGGGLLSVGAAIAILYASGIGAPLAFIGTIIVAIGAIAFSYDQTTFEAELERLAEPMICAIVNASGASTAVQAMRDTLVSEGVDQSIIDYVMEVTGTNAMNKLFNGEIVVPDSFVEPTTCDCVEPALIHTIFGSGQDLSPWTLESNTYVHNAGYTMMQIGSQWTKDANFWTNNLDCRTLLGGYTNMRVTRIRIRASTSNTPDGRAFDLRLRTSDEQDVYVAEFVPSALDWYEWSGDVILAPDDADTIIFFDGENNGSSASEGINLYEVEVYGELII